VRGVVIQAYVEAFEFEDEFEGVADSLIVIDDEDRPCGRWHGEPEM
jgi:hypothetical protein